MLKAIFFGSLLFFSINSNAGGPSTWLTDKQKSDSLELEQVKKKHWSAANEDMRRFLAYPPDFIIKVDRSGKNEHIGYRRFNLTLPNGNTFPIDVNKNNSSLSGEEAKRLLNKLMARKVVNQINGFLEMMDPFEILEFDRIDSEGYIAYDQNSEIDAVIAVGEQKIDQWMNNRENFSELAEMATRNWEGRRVPDLPGFNVAKGESRRVASFEQYINDALTWNSQSVHGLRHAATFNKELFENAIRYFYFLRLNQKLVGKRGLHPKYQ